MVHLLLRRAVLFLFVLLTAVSVMAQGSGGGGGGGGSEEGGSETGHGDVFGDLIHILRSAETGQPILQKRLIEYPEDLIDWGYCPIPVDAAGVEIPFAPLSCDVDPTQLPRLVEVDYFGRLSGGRTRERNIRMHFDEVISNIQDAEQVSLDPVGRLKLGTGCTGPDACAEWKVIDSPLENMSLYHRIMKYGHIQTNPLEEDTSFHGDPALGTVYHPALRAEDWLKFAPALANLLPGGDCFPTTGFVATCADRQALTAPDFLSAAAGLAGAADKHGRMTMDLIQYFNRILKITQTTADSLATLNTLPALIRDENGVVAPATTGLPWPASELFVDFTPAAYLRTDVFTQSPPLLVSAGVGLWQETPAVSLLPFLELANGPAVSATNIDAFVRNAADGQRAVEFVHEYEIPVDLYAVYAPVTEPTTTTVENMTVETSPVDRTITLKATVTNTTPVNAGMVTFTVRTGGAVMVGLPAVSTFFTNGVATASYVVPADTAVQVLDVEASYSGAPGFAPSIGTGTLEIVAMVPPALPVSNGSADFDGDGIYDILVQHDTDWSIAAWRMNYSEPIGTLPIGNPGTGWKIAGIADLDGDGVSDILMQHTNSYVGAWKMNATGQIVSFLQVAFYDLGDWKVVGTADLDGDADSDILLQHSNGYVGAWRMDGAGNATEFLPVVFGDTNGWKVVGAADVDSDGISDILLQHTNSYVGYWKMDGAGNVGAFSFVAEYDTGGWKVVGTLDLNDDNKADILLQNADSWVGAWLMNGAGQPSEFVPVVFEDTGGWWVNGKF